MRVRLHDLRRGLGYGYPLCCVLTYVLDPHWHRARRRGVVDLGVRPNGEKRVWVPCMFHAHRHPRWRPCR